MEHLPIDSVSQEGTLAYRCITNADGSYDWSCPPPNAEKVDDRHYYTKLFWPNNPYPEAGHPEDAEWAGIDEWHQKADGTWCVGYCLFAVPGADAWAHAYVGDMKTRWQVTFLPLTMTPSIACKVCPSHGFLTAGKWVGN